MPNAALTPTGPSRRAALRHARTALVGLLAAASAAFVVASVVVPLTTNNDNYDSAEASRPASKSQLEAVLGPRAAVDGAALGHPATTQGGAATLPARPPKITTALISRLAANGIPTTALNAYRVAAARIDHSEPACNLHWPLLAGIGRVESDHGQTGGAVLLSNGLSSPRIIGPALNGTAGNRSIPAPANGQALDGDAVYAHALGPMQFIPSTWAVYGTDADGDGTADIFDIDDAALAAGRYLCAAGGNLATYTNRKRAVYSYNNLHAYVAEVLALAHAYRTGTTVTGIPVGDLTGALPPLGTSRVNAAGLTPAQLRTRARQRALARDRARRRADQNPLTLVPGGTTTPRSSSAPKPTPTRSTTTSTAPRPTRTPPTSAPPTTQPTTSPTQSPTPTATGTDG